jgi:hypothetical protein
MSKWRKKLKEITLERPKKKSKISAISLSKNGKNLHP